MTTPFWLDEPYAPRAPLQGAATADIAVLGGGITGIAAARFLALRGCNVALVEKGTVCSGATGRNAGFLLAGTAHPYSIAVKVHGRERAKRLWKISRENHDALRQMIEEEALSCLYVRNGSYLLAVTDKEDQVYQETVKALLEDGFPAERIDPAAAERLFPGSAFKGGLFNPGDGEIHPARLVRGLAQAAERRGAKIFENTPVVKIENAGNAVTLIAGQGRLSASMLLLAANAYSPLLHPYFEDVIVAMRGQMFATEPCPERLIPAPTYADFGFEYVRQLPDGRILAGGGRRASLDTELTYVEKPSDKVQKAIEDFLHAHFPAARKLKITHRWAGLMGFSCDELPNIGPIPGHVNLYAAAGYHGHGMGFAVMAARAVTEMMLDGKTSVPCEIFSPRRHLP